MIDIDEPQSRGWWMHRLARQLKAQVKELEPLDARLRGDGPLPYVSNSLRQSFRDFQKKSRTNWPEIIVESARERMTVVGFRTSPEGRPATRGFGIASEDPSDDEAMAIWRANNLAVDSADVHESMLGLRYGYVIVGPPREGEEYPAITGEDPLQVVTVHDPVRPQKVRAALKMFHDDEFDQDFAYLYLPGELHVATRQVRRRVTNPTITFSASQWDWDDERSGNLPESFSDTVPVVRFCNRKGVSDFEHHTDLLDRIDFQVLQRVAGAALQAFRQRAVKGDLPEKDEDGNTIDYNDIFEADPGALWRLPEGVDLWESGQIDLSSILNAGKDDLKQLSALTKTPLNQLMPGEVAQSAEGAAFQREGLVFRVEDRIARATEGWRDVMSYAFRYIDDEDRADRNRIEVLWAPAERRSLAERADASSKAQDIPWRSRMIHIWGFTPTQVDQMEVERIQDATIAAIASGAADEDEETGVTESGGAVEDEAAGAVGE